MVALDWVCQVCNLQPDTVLQALLYTFVALWADLETRALCFIFSFFNAEGKREQKIKGVPIH